MMLQLNLATSNIIVPVVLFLFIFISLLQLDVVHCDFWPEATGGDITVDTSITVNASQTFDCNYTRYIPNPDTLGDGGQEERQKAVFILLEGATLKNCIIGAKEGAAGSADGVHLTEAGGTLQNVWFENVGEDAVTFYGLTGDDITYTVDGGGARDSEDKIFQFDGKGTATIKNFWADTFARFARTCGNCENQYERHLVLSNVTALNGEAGQFIAGINTNYGDSATLTGIKLGGSTAKEVNPCKKFIGVTSGEPTSNGTDADGVYCIYKESDITYI